jgi:hypothetical protein
MEPAVQKFTREFARRVVECDGPPHRYGAINCDANPRQQAEIQRNLDNLARGAAAVQQTINGNPGAGSGGPQ